GLLAAGLLSATVFAVHSSRAQTPAPKLPASTDARAVFDQYCVKCHNDKAQTAGLSLEKIDVNNPASAAEALEKVIIKLRQGSMPPAGNPRPDPETYHAVALNLESALDKAWAAKP